MSARDGGSAGAGAAARFAGIETAMTLEEQMASRLVVECVNRATRSGCASAGGGGRGGGGRGGAGGAGGRPPGGVPGAPPIK